MTIPTYTIHKIQSPA